jgi:molybdopterin biosynthesis enzyme MoaB
VAVDPKRQFKPIGIAVLTVSDTRDMGSDTSGALLVERIQAAGHCLGAHWSRTMPPRSARGSTPGSTSAWPMP